MIIILGLQFFYLAGHMGLTVGWFGIITVKINNVVFDLILYISISTFPMCARNTALQPATCWRRSSQSKVKDDNGCKPQILGSKAKTWKDCLALLFWRSLCAAMWDGGKKIQIFQRFEIDAKENTVAQGTNWRLQRTMLQSCLKGSMMQLTQDNIVKYTLGALVSFGASVQWGSIWVHQEILATVVPDSHVLCLYNTDHLCIWTTYIVTVKFTVITQLKGFIPLDSES